MTLYELRKSREITAGHNIPASSIARACGIAPMRYWRIETGKLIPNALETRALANQFTISLEEMTAIIDETVKRRNLDENTPPEREESQV